MSGTSHWAGTPLHAPSHSSSRSRCSSWARWPRASSTGWGLRRCCVFLGARLLLGEDGPGGIQFDNATLARDVGLSRWRSSLLEGGMLAERSGYPARQARPSCLPQLGVLLTAGGGGRRHPLSVGLGWSTACWSAPPSRPMPRQSSRAMRGTHVRRRLAAVLEAESGLNDPFAALLVIGLVEWSTRRFRPTRATARCCSCGRRHSARRAGSLSDSPPSGSCRPPALPNGGPRRWSPLAVLAGYVGVWCSADRASLAAYIGLDRRRPHPPLGRHPRLSPGRGVAGTTGVVRPARASRDAIAHVRPRGWRRSSSPRAGTRGRARSRCSSARRLLACHCATRASWRGPGCAAACRSCSRRSRSPRACRAASAFSTRSSSSSCSRSRLRD